MDKKTVSKISFTGDIMCERPFINAAKKRGMGFSGFLDPCKELFAKSDLVVGNLETPCDPDSPLSKDMFIFNAPVSFVSAIKESGIDFVTTATNHCLDRGLTGLKSTIRTLDQVGLEHTGTFDDRGQDRFKVVDLPDGTRVAVVSYTYGTNYLDNKVLIEPEDYYSINYLTPLYGGRNKATDNMSYSLRSRLTRAIPRGLRTRVNAMLGRQIKAAFTDCLQDGDLGESEIASICDTIEKAHKAADLVAVCPHFGGQFNLKHGTYVDAFVDLFDKAGADLIIGNHPHVVQQYETAGSGMKIAYSLGNVSMSLSTPYIELKDLPECSVMLHAYIQNKKICKMSFSVLVEKEDRGFISVYPLAALYENSSEQYRKELQVKNNIIYNRFTGCEGKVVPVDEEYVLWELSE